MKFGELVYLLVYFVKAMFCCWMLSPLISVDNNRIRLVAQICP
jgi:hypothetical protein